MSTNLGRPPGSGFTVTDIRNRAELLIPDVLAPDATCCVVVEPVSLTESWVSMFTIDRWIPNPGRQNCYGRCFDDALVYISMEDEYWVIEVSYPWSRWRRPAALLGLGCSLAVTLNPMAAVQLAKTCLADNGPPIPFKWIPYL